MFESGMSADTVDKDVQEWERIDAAIAFRLPNGDELLIARRVKCPDCGRTYLLGLANKDTVSYARRHDQCAVNNTVHGMDEESSDG